MRAIYKNGKYYAFGRVADKEDKNTVLLLKSVNGEIVDLSPNRHEIINLGDVVAEAQGFTLQKPNTWGNALQINGELFDYNGDWTIEWIEVAYDGVGSSTTGLISSDRNSKTTYTSLFGYGGNGVAYLGTGNGDGWKKLTNWLHKYRRTDIDTYWCIVKKGDKLFSYENGILFGETVILNPQLVISTPTRHLIGAYTYSNSKGYNAHIKEFKISNIARYDSNFDSSKVDWQPKIDKIEFNQFDRYVEVIDENTTCLLKSVNGEIVDIKGNEVINNNAVVNEQGFTLNDIASYSEGGSWLELPYDVFNNDGDFTIEWIEECLGAQNNYATPFRFGDIHSGNGFMAGYSGIRMYGGSAPSGWNKISGVIIKERDLTQSTHWVVQQKNNVITSYKNGILFKSHTVKNTAPFYKGENSVCLIGRYTSHTGYNAHIKEFKISNIARYDADFDHTTVNWTDKVKDVTYLTQSEVTNINNLQELGVEPTNDDKENIKILNEMGVETI